MGYRYLAADLRSGELLAYLPLQGVSFSDQLSAPGEFSGTLEMYDAQLGVPSVQRATAPGRTALYVDLDGQLLWGGIIWRREKSSAGELAISASGFLSYLGKRLITTDVVFAGADQFTMARSLVNGTKLAAGGDIGIDTSSPVVSGVTRSQLYKGTDRHSVLDTLQELAATVDGFDIAISASYGPTGIPVKTLVLGHPGLGRAADTTDLLLEYPGQVASYSWPEEGDRISNAVYVRGVSTGTTSIDVLRVNPLSILDGYPLLESEVTAPALQASESLASYGDGQLAAYDKPVALPVLTLPAGGDQPALAAYGPGDHFRVRLTDAEWFPAGAGGAPGYDAPMRLITRSVSVDDNGGGHSVQLTMRPLVGGLTAGAFAPLSGPIVPVITPDPVDDSSALGAPVLT